MSRSAQNHFVYIQVEATEILFQVFRYEEQGYDAVLIEASSIDGDFLNARSLEQPLRELINRLSRFPQARIIVGFHAGLFVTRESVVTLRRAEPRTIIDEAELENLISSGLWKVFSRSQADIAQKIATPESSVVMLNAFIEQVRVDGHRVVSPVGFPAHTVELTIRYGATSRIVREFLAPLLSGEQEIYVVEIGVSELSRLTEYEKSCQMLVRVSETRTYVYASSEDGLGHVDTINWGRFSLIHAVMDTFMIAQEQAVALLSRMERGLTSDLMRKKVEGLLAQEVAVLLKGIEAHTERIGASQVYVSAPFSIPSVLFRQSGRGRADTAIPVHTIPYNPHSGKDKSALPLSVKPNASSLSALCAIAHAAVRFFEPSDLQKIAKRRARWLVGESNS